MWNQNCKFLGVPKSSGVRQTSNKACTLLVTEGCNGRTQESATSLVVMTTPICDASMQEEKKKKEKEKEKTRSKGWFNSLPSHCQLGRYWVLRLY
jgi:hypothetical protein